ncbi:MAG: sensor histidine kinase [Microbacteriaceae bacterium]
MIQWFLDRRWFPETMLSAFLALVFGALDTSIQGPKAWLPTVLISLSVIFVRNLQWIAIVLIAAGTSLEIFWRLAPLAGGMSAAIALVFIASFAGPIIRQVAVILTNVSGLVVAYIAILESPQRLWPFGVHLASDNSPWFAFFLVALCIVSVNTLAWVFGRLAITRLLHVGTDSDRAILVHRQAQLGLEVAKQTERLGIARDLTDLLVQRVSAVLSLSEAAKYVAKADADSAIRTISRIADSATGAQSELRKLYDLLHEDHELNAAPPSLEEIPDLIRSMREFGYSASLNVEGIPFAVNEGAQLCLFKIVFESLENVKKHTPSQTDVAVNFYWTEDGLQVLIKDNGLETKRRREAADSMILEGYTPEEDLETLVNRVEGATLSALRERAALYEGSIDTTEVAGVGFTVAAFFPNLRNVAGL